ncbi:MAG: beta-ketoacyl reductase [Candidatus Cloacimonadota bacterium]|nr:beta-ketoacyl reductase [Candidatus Cloacimonadota bacterium]
MKRIMITGANSQIGSFLARQYEQEGRELILLYHTRDDRLKKIKTPLLSVDLRDLEATQSLISKIEGSIGALIHCSAVRSVDNQALVDTNPQDFKRVFDDNFYPAYHILRTVLPIMRKQNFGRVILFSSDVTRSGLANGSAYAAAKAAIANLAKSAALENAKHNVLVNCIAPAPVDTVLEEDFSGSYLEFRKAYFAKHLANSAAEQLVSRAEIKQVADFLISADIRTLCGEEIFLTGGKA